MEVPDGYELQLRARSGLAAKHCITLTNSVGTIDSDYRGEVQVLLTRMDFHGKENYTISNGDRICQGVLVPVVQANFQERTLSNTVRGEGKFGSTGT